MKLQRANYPAKSKIYASREAWVAAGAVPAEPADSPPLAIGERCQLVGGSQTLLVVDIEPTFTVAWKNECGVSEHEIDRGAVRRCP